MGDPGKRRKISSASLAVASAARPKLTIGIWVAVVAVAAMVSSSMLSDGLTSEARFVNKPESQRAMDLIEEKLTGEQHVTEIVIVRSKTDSVDSSRFRLVVEELADRLKALGPSKVLAVVDYPSTNEPALVSADKRTTIINVVLAGDFAQAQETIDAVHAITLEGKHPAGFEVLQAGEATLDKEFSTIAEEDLAKGEQFSFPLTLLILVLVFGAVVAAFVPVIMAVLAIMLSLGVVAVLGQVWDFSFFVVNMITMMGLAVGIDYSLFIVSRYREERAHGRDKAAAIARAGDTASRAVFFSGLTVVLALVGMLIIPTTIFRSLAGGAILVVLASIAASLTLLPAVLSLLGDKVNSWRIPGLQRRRTPGVDHDGFWDRTTKRVMAHPVISIVLTAGLLLGAASAVLDMRTGFSGVSTLEDDVQSKKAFTVLATDFAAGMSQPAQIVINSELDAGTRSAIADLRAALADDPLFGPPSEQQTNEAGDLSLINVPLRADPSSDAATQAIHRLRDRHVPRAFAAASDDVLVGGMSAIGADFFALTDDYTPIVFLFVLGLSFLLLTVVFRSLVVPAKAIVMNLLSVGAAYGFIVLVNQKGYLADLFGFEQVEVIESWLPLFLFSVLFGLSMDYHVFLLSRIRERYDQTHDNTESVRYGVHSTARIITGAALIMVSVFAGFASGQLVMMQQMGFGLGIAVLIDATIVRSVLVPASMKLLGDWNWYLPKWLEWLPQVNVEGAHEDAEVHFPLTQHVIDLDEQVSEEQKAL